MASQFQEYHVQLINKRTGSTIDDDTGICNVLTADTPAEATIYSDDNGTAASNPLTITDGEISFFTASSVQTVDITGLTANGEPFFLAGLTPSQHRLEIDEDDLSERILVLPWAITASSGGMIDTGFDLNALHVVKDVRVKVTTAGGTSNILNVGHSASVSGFFNAVISVANSGLVVRKEQFGGLACANPVAATICLTLNGWYGVSMLYSATDNTNKKPYNIGAATSVVYYGANQTGATGAGYIYMIMDKLVV